MMDKYQLGKDNENGISY